MTARHTDSVAVKVIALTEWGSPTGSGPCVPSPQRVWSCWPAMHPSGRVISDERARRACAATRRMANAMTNQQVTCREACLGRALVCASLLVATAACGTGDSKRADPVTTESAESVIHATYRLTTHDDDDWYAEYDVLLRGDRQARVEFTVPVDDPVTIYRWTWDGERLLEFGDDEDGTYTLYEAPEEHPELMSSLTQWIVDDSPDAEVCTGHHLVKEKREFVGRDAVGYRCDDQGTVWVDEETRLLLGYSSTGDGGGEGPDAMEVTSVTVDASVEEDAFATDPPRGEEVEVVEATGHTASPG